MPYSRQQSGYNIWQHIYKLDPVDQNLDRRSSLNLFVQNTIYLNSTHIIYLERLALILWAIHATVPRYIHEVRHRGTVAWVAQGIRARRSK